jgi:hypothetical protein
MRAAMDPVPPKKRTTVRFSAAHYTGESRGPAADFPASGLPAACGRQPDPSDQNGLFKARVKACEPTRAWMDGVKCLSSAHT